jgi:hypothetical protein
MNSEPPLTKSDMERAFKDLRSDMDHALKDLRQFIVEREVVSIRWVIGIQIAYFFSTLAAVWFMLAHYKP